MAKKEVYSQSTDLENLKYFFSPFYLIMVIYDKNQLTFNIIFAVILGLLILLNIFYAKNFYDLKLEYDNITQTLSKIESNQNFNFIQGTHNNIEYQLNPQGF